MKKFNEKRVSSIINPTKEGQKLFQSKPQKLKSHIIFKGDPAFHQDSVEYIPVTRRKPIFESNNQNILPPDLLLNQQDLIEHNNNMKSSQQIHQNIINNLDRQMDPFGYNIYDDRNRNIKKRISFQQDEIYFEPNNLETDLNFGMMPQNQNEFNPAIHLSKASQTTQKKGQNSTNNLNELRPSQIIINPISSTPQSSGQNVNFTYLSKPFSKENDQFIESRVKKVTTVINKSPIKSNSKTIFLNEGGVMVSKVNNKISIQESDYFDFDVINEKNESLINELKLAETPQFNIKKGKSSQIINKFLNEDDKSVNQERNAEKYRKSASDGNKILIEGRNSPNKFNHVNSSIVSYKSVQKQFDNQALQNQPNRVSDIKSPQNSQIKAQQSLINQIFENNLQQKKQKGGPIDESMSFQKQGSASLFDKILKERQSIFSKNKEPEMQLKNRKSEKKSTNKIETNLNTISDSQTIQKPDDFLTDSHFAPPKIKRTISIGDMPPSLPPKLSQNQPNIQHETPILQNKIKRAQLKNETEETSKYIPSKKQATKKNVNFLNSPNRKSNESIPENVGNEDDEEQEDEIDLEEEDYIEQDEDSSQQSSEQQKQIKLKKAKKQNSKRQKKKKHQTDINLDEYLKKQQQKIQLKEIKKMMNIVPQIKNVLRKKSKNGKSKEKNQQQTEPIRIPVQSQQPVVYTAPNQLNSLQRQLLQTVGIKLVQDSVPKYSQPQFNQFPSQPPLQIGNQNNWSQIQSNGLQMPHQFQQNIPYLFSYQSQIHQQQNKNQQETIQSRKMSEKIIGIPFNQYSKNQQDNQRKFEQITRVLYHHLVNAISLPSNVVNPPQPFIQNRGQHSSTNKSSPVEIGSAFSFKNQNHYEQKASSISAYEPQKTFERSDTNKKQFQRQKSELYSKEIYDELRRFSPSKNKKRNSKQKSKLSFDESQMDDTHYYSFYHDDQQDLKRNKSSTVYNKDGYYPVKKEKTRVKEVPSEKSMKEKFQLKNSSQLAMLYQKIQQLSKELHQQLPLIRKQIEENQQEIRNIQTNLLIKGTAEQHALIKALQKMKLKDRQLQQKQIEAQHRNHQLSMYQNQLASFKTKYITSTNQLMQNLQMENYFQQRLGKLQNYNEKLCKQLSHKKTPISPKIVPQKPTNIPPQHYYHLI